MSAQPARSTTTPMTISAIGEDIRLLRKQNDTEGMAESFPAEAWDATEQAIKNLEDLALAMPPKTLADVAVQAELAHSISEGLADCDTIPAAARAEIHRLRHVLAGAAVLLGEDAHERVGKRSLASLAWPVSGRASIAGTKAFFGH